MSYEQSNPFLEQIPNLPDYYKAFSVPRSATDADISKAFRKVSVLYHPDKKPGDKEAAEYFKKLSNYRDVLKDEKQRKWYDTALKAQESGSRKPARAKSPSPRRERSTSSRPSAYYYEEREPNHTRSRAYTAGHEYAHRPRNYAEEFAKAEFEERHPNDYTSSGRRPRYEYRSPQGEDSDSGYCSSDQEGYQYSDHDSDCSCCPPRSRSPPKKHHRQAPRSSAKPAATIHVFVIIDHNHTIVPIEKEIFQSHFPTLEIRKKSDTYRVDLTDKQEPCLIVRLLAFAKGDGFLDMQTLRTYDEKYQKFEDKYKLARDNSTTAAKLYLRLYNLAKSLRMPSKTTDALQSKFIVAWHWGLSHSDYWLEPSFESEPRRRMTEEKCKLAEFVYNHGNGDRALLDPVLRTLQFEMTYRDDQSTMDLLPILKLVSHVPQLAIDLATTRILRGAPITCHKCCASKDALRIICRCAKVSCPRKDCNLAQLQRWFCPVCGERP